MLKYSKRNGIQYHLCRDCNRKKAHKYYIENSDKIKEINKNYVIRNPEKLKAWIKSRGIKKKPCIICGNRKSVRHHEDYNKPKEVISLCLTHHKELHLGKLVLDIYKKVRL